MSESPYFVVGSALWNHPEICYHWLKQATQIIAADGGLRLLKEVGIEPTLWVGDGDSYGEQLPENLQAVRVSPKKAKSDSQLAIELAFERGASRVVLLGGLGGRLDHQVANLNLLNLYPDKLLMADGDVEAMVVSQQIEFHATVGDLVSLFPINGPVGSPMGNQEVRLKTSGLAYPLQNEVLRSDSHGLSNCVDASTVTIEVLAGHLLLIRSWEKPTTMHRLFS